MPGLGKFTQQIITWKNMVTMQCEKRSCELLKKILMKSLVITVSPPPKSVSLTRQLLLHLTDPAATSRTFVGTH